MEFSLLNKQTIQCTMTEEEIAGYGLDKQAIFKNDGRVQDFFRQVMHQAQQATGFTGQRGNVMVHAAFLPDELLKITFSVDSAREGHAQNESVRKPKWKTGGNPGLAENFTTAVFKSKDIASVARFCRQMPAMPKTWMYKYQGNYFLLAKIHALTPRQKAALFCLADEYVDENCYTPGIAAFLKEHGTCVIAENAAEILGGL